MAGRSAYVHIPFCRQKCHYCDFAVHVVGSRARAPRTETLMSGYVDTLVREIRATACATCNGTARASSSRQRPAHDRTISGITGLSMEPLQTVYLGGGTPSLLPVPLMARVLDEIDHRFGIADDAEVTLEADPGTFTTQSLNALHAIGINRLSVGVQAFQDRVLASVGRTHSAEDARAAVAAVLASPFQANWSLDLLFGLPSQTNIEWAETVALAIEAGPQHISTYGLTIEPGSTWGKRGYEEDVAPLPRGEIVAEMYEMVHNDLSGAGYEHYEVSNFAKLGLKSRHNQVYWTGRPFYGFGVGATSCDAQLRVRRPRSISSWNRWVKKLEEKAQHFADTGAWHVSGYASSSAASVVEPRVGLAGCRSEELWVGAGVEIEEVQPVDTVIAGLRTAKGVSLQALRDAADRANIDKCAERSSSPCTVATEGVTTTVLAARKRTAADVLQGLWPLLLALQKQGVLELHVEQSDYCRGGDGDVATGLISHLQSSVNNDKLRTHALVGSCEHTRLLSALQGNVRLTAPKGFLLADGITAEIWAALENHGLQERFPNNRINVR